MKDEHLDHIIKEKMEGLEFPYKAEHWDLFAEKLDESEGGPAALPAQEFDAQVFDKVNDYHASNQSMQQHWALFERKLNQILDIRNTLLRYKFTELTLMVLLLFIVIRWSDQISQKAIELESTLPQAFVIPGDNSSTSANAEVLNADKGDVQQNPIVENDAQESLQSIASTAKSSEGLDSKKEKEIAAGAVGSEVFIPNIRPTSSKETFTAPIATLESPTRYVSMGAETDLLLRASLSSTLPQAISERPATEEIAALESPARLISWEPMDNILDKEIKIKPRWNTHISMAGGGEVNQVITPQDEENSINANETFSFGYRGGITMDFGRGDSPLRFGSGFIYSAKQYSIGKTFITGSLLRSNLTAEELDNVEFNIVNVPVFARYRFMDKKRWSMFTQVGLSVQMAMQANYYVEVPNPRDLPAPTSIGQIVQTPENQSNFLNRNDGLFEGGNFKENSFFTVNLSMGLERLMTDRFSLFLQSQYEYPFGYFTPGLGPTRDRFNTLSIESGVRVRLR